MEGDVRKLFDRYASLFNQALSDGASLDDVAALYAKEFIAAGPSGVMTGKNDDQLKTVMAKGYERYRAMGTREMRIRDIHVSPIDGLHCLAHVAWSASYARQGQADTVIDFEVHYLVQALGGDPKVFGWVSGDEQALLKQHGII